MVEGVERRICKENFFPNIVDLDPGQFPSLHEREKRRDALLFLISQKVVHPFNPRKLLGIDLGIAPGYDEQGIGTGTMGPADHLSRLKVGPVSHGAGIDNGNVGLLTEGNNPIPFLFDRFGKDLRLELVDLTTEGRNRNCLHDP